MNEKIIFTNIALDFETIYGSEDRFQVWAESKGSRGLLATLSTKLPQVPIRIEIETCETVEFYVEPFRGDCTWRYHVPDTPLLYIAFHTKSQIK